jgi:soluble lytic murein transglycosylase
VKGPKLQWGKRKRIGYTLAAALLLVLLLPVLLQKPIQKIFYPIRYEQQVRQWSAEYSLDPLLVYAVIRTESSFRPGAESSAGARGLMQMTEDTFHWLKSQIAPDETLTFGDLFEPNTAIRFGAYYLSISLQRYGGDFKTAAAAYHSGWGTVNRLLSDLQYTNDGLVLTQFPYDQMNHYVNKVQKSYNIYRELYQYKTHR